MKIKSLLAAVSMVALATGSANALNLTNTTAAGALSPALELALPGSPSATGVFSFDLNTNDPSTFPGGSNVQVTINLPGGTSFATAFNPALVLGPVASVPTIQGGGAEGDTFVELSLAIQQPNDDFDTGGGTLSFSVDLSLNGCPTSALSVTNVQTGNNNPIEEGSATADAENRLIGPCASAIDGVVRSDQGDSDTVITLDSDYTQLAEFVGGVQTAGAIVLGDINYTVDPDVTLTIPSLTPLDEEDIAAIRFSVLFEDASGITNCSIKPDSMSSNGSIGITTPNGNQCDFNFTDPDDIELLINGVPDQIRVTTAGGDDIQIPTQTVSVGNSAVIFRATGTPDLIPSEAGAAGALDPLQREGRQFGYFDWNAGPNVPDPTLSVYRITGLTPGSAVDYSLTLENSNNDGTYSGTLPIANDAGEVGLISTMMPIPADTERFDVLINIETPNEDVDIDRQMIRGDVVSAFGDGANNDQEDPLEPNLNDDDN